MIHPATRRKDWLEHPGGYSSGGGAATAGPISPIGGTPPATVGGGPIGPDITPTYHGFTGAPYTGILHVGGRFYGIGGAAQGPPSAPAPVAQSGGHG